eukprot:COSAG02_NODE_50385_length_320_cov_64.076923_1_plen_64_part_01
MPEQFLPLEAPPGFLAGSYGKVPLFCLCLCGGGWGRVAWGRESSLRNAGAIVWKGSLFSAFWWR